MSAPPARPELPPAARCARCGEPAAAATCARCGARPVVGASGGAPRARRPLFLAGLAGVPRGLSFVGRHPRLWVWILLPLAVSAALFGGIALGGWHLSRAWVPDLSQQHWGWFEGLRTLVAPTLAVLFGALSVFVALIVTLLLAGVVNAPFHDLLAERVESLVLARADPGRPWSAFLGDAWAALAGALRLALWQAVVLGLLFLLSFTVIGAPLFALAGFYYAGFALCDVTLARKRYDARARAAWARRHGALLLGLGAPVQLFPPLQPFGIVGATLLYLESPDKG